MRRQKPPFAKADAKEYRDFNRDFAIRRAPDKWFPYQIDLRIMCPSKL